MHHLLTLHLVLGLAARGTAAGPQGPPGDGPIIGMTILLILYLQY